MVDAELLDIGVTWMICSAVTEVILSNDPRRRNFKNLNVNERIWLRLVIMEIVDHELQNSNF